MSIENAPQLPKQEIPPGTPALPAPETGSGKSPNQQLSGEERRTIAFIVIGIIVFVIALIGSIIYLVNADPGDVAQIRDIFIIYLAIQSLFIGLVLVILIIQLARLINLLQNEVKPILDSTNETISNLRGTTVFLSESVVEPVIKMNEYLAGLTQLLAVLGLMKRSSKK